MIFYHRQGNIPTKKHTVFRNPETEELYWEELFGEEGFDGIYSTKYHHHLPTAVDGILHHQKLNFNWKKELPLQAIHFNAYQKNGGDLISSKIAYLGNKHLRIYIVTPTINQDEFYKNADFHELYFVHEGHGTLSTEYGKIEFREGDYLCLPKACIYQFNFKGANNRMLLIESRSAFKIPTEFKNKTGQLLEQAPYCERDFRLPQLQEPIIDKEKHSILIQNNDQIVKYHINHHPFNLVGWDGYLYPVAFNIDDYCPIVGKLHQPPSVHKVFENNLFMLTNFVPRLLDFHQQAIPVPYYHSNTDSEEVLYYVKGNFMSRKGIKEGSITLHPSGIPHGPQPGVVENSLGQQEVNECAIMIDAYQRLYLSSDAQKNRYPDYYQSWST